MRIALVGYGKMGKRIAELAEARGHTISHKIARGNAHELHNLRDTDVAIEFTTPEAAVGNFEVLLAQGIPMVTGTTGWYQHFDAVVQKATHAGVPFMYATNFSVGVHLSLAAHAYLAKLMNGHRNYLCHIDEWHHTAKKDAPSGTAITFAERLIENHGGYTSWQLDAEAGTEVLPVRAYRENEIPGTHRVTYQSPIDEISLEHKAYSRDGFARGAIDAAAWLTTQKPGVYTMKDLLQL